MALFNLDTSRATASSPSVSLERGSYRMRAPPPRPPPFILPGKAPPVVQHRVNRNIALLLLLLALSCMTCFASAYYLFTTRWDFRPASQPHSRANATSKANVSDSATHQSEKYLAYLPHSGFHNQRIAFENALVLSSLLRRTLLVPPIRLGSRPIRYVEFNTLSRHHELSAREGLSHCPRIPGHLSRPPECLEYFDSSYLPWNWLVNLSAVTAEQSVFQRPNMSLAWIQARFNIESSDIYTLADDSPYSFRFLDTPEDDTSAKYTRGIDIAELAAVNHTLLQLGTLFGSSRLRLRDPYNIVLRQSFRRAMLFVNSDLTQAARQIAHSLKHTYLGLHLRSGDGKFEQNISNITGTAWCQVLRGALSFSESEVRDLAKTLLKNPPPPCSGLTFQDPPRLPHLPNLQFHGRCRSLRHSDERYLPLNVPLYIATDLSDVDVNPSLSIFHETFPCLFFLHDFAEEIALLTRIRSPYDNVNVKPFLLPFVDALVVGGAMRSVGTEGSTFSKFIDEILRAGLED